MGGWVDRDGVRRSGKLNRVENKKPRFRWEAGRRENRFLSLRSGRLRPCPASVAWFTGGGNHSLGGMWAFALGEFARLPEGAGKRHGDLIDEAAGVQGAGGLVKHRRFLGVATEICHSERTVNDVFKKIP